MGSGLEVAEPEMWEEFGLTWVGPKPGSLWSSHPIRSPEFEKGGRGWGPGIEDRTRGGAWLQGGASQGLGLTEVSTAQGSLTVSGLACG